MKAFISHNKAFFNLLLISVLLKIIIMPFFAHADFLSMWRRVYTMITENYYYPQKETLVTYFVQIIYLSFVRFFIPKIDSMLYLSDFCKSTATLTEYLTFVSYTEVFRLLFFLKFLFLIFDITIGIILYKHYYRENKVKALVVSSAWLFNPIIIYTLYIFGRYEVIPLFFMLMIIITLNKHKYIASALLFALLINSREIYLLLFPIYLLSMYGKNKASYKTLFITAMIVVGAKVLPPYIIEKIFNIKPLFFSHDIVQSDRKNSLIGLNIIYFHPFVAFYTAILIMLFCDLKHSPLTKFLKGSFLFFGAYYAFGSFSPHYVSWSILIPTVLLNKVSDLKVYVIFIISWFIHSMIMTDDGVFTLLLASPMTLKMGDIPTFPEFYVEYLEKHINIDIDMARNLVRTVFTTSIFYLYFALAGFGGAKYEE